MGGKGKGKKRKNHVLESVVFSWFAHTGLYVTNVGGKGGGKKRKNHVLEVWFFRGLPIRASTSLMWGAREEVKKRKNHVLESVFFSWFAHTGLYVTHVGGKGGSKETKKPRFRKRVFFVVCPYGPLRHPCGGKGKGKKRNNHVFESMVFSWFAHTGLYVTHVGAREKVKNETTTF